MKILKNIIILSSIASFSSLSFAETISATASTLDGAERKIALKAEKSGMSYKVIGAHTGNYTYMIAKLVD